MLNTQHRPASCEAPGCDGAVRNRYYPRKLMTAAAFGADQDYMIDRRRMLNRALHGWGVVGGLDVRLAGGRLEVLPGVALDKHGREIVLTEARVVDWCDVLVDGKCRAKGRPDIAKGHWVLTAHYAERGVGKVRLADDCGCGEEAWDSTCETVAFALTPWPDGPCPCGDPGCPHDCGCVHDGCYKPVGRREAAAEADRLEEIRREEVRKAAEAEAAKGGQKPPEPEKPPEHEPYAAPTPPYPRGPHATLCCWSDHADVLEDPGRLTCDWRGMRLDPCDGVALACFYVGECKPEPAPEKDPKYPEAKSTKPAEPCCDPKVEDLDPCTVRRFVKRSDLLFDLIRGCDLTRIVGLSWSRFVDAGEAPWADFKGQFRADEIDESEQTPDECLTRFTVEFSGPVQARTVTTLNFTITASFRADVAGWFEAKRVPVVRIDFETRAGDPPGTARRATAVVLGSWAKSQIGQSWDKKIQTEFLGDTEAPAYYPIIDIEIDGGRILDCRGQPVAAAAFGPHITPTGLGYPGGLCRSSFRVVPLPPARR